MSKIVHIEGTEDTPSILLDPVKNEIRIKGISMPENAFEFYDPIEKKALEIFKNTKATLLIEIELFYMNSMSNKQVLKLIKQISAASSQVKVNWRYAPGDTLIKMKGEEIRSICSNLEVLVQETT
jgi:hypothetical protein